MQVRIWGELNCSYGGKNLDNTEGQTVQHAAVQMHPHAWGILKWNLGFVFVWLRTVETTRLVTSFTSSYLNVPLLGHLCNATAKRSEQPWLGDCHLPFFGATPFSNGPAIIKSGPWLWRWSPVKAWQSPRSVRCHECIVSCHRFVTGEYGNKS